MLSFKGDINNQAKTEALADKFLLTGKGEVIYHVSFDLRGFMKHIDQGGLKEANKYIVKLGDELPEWFLGIADKMPFV